MGGRKPIPGKKGNKTEGGDAPVRTKPKFDKKKWRERKYSNKYKISKWEEKKEKSVIQQFYKELKKDPNYANHFTPNTIKQNSEEESEPSSRPETQTDPSTSSVKEGKKKKLNSYQAARAEMQRIKLERQKEKEAYLKRKQEIKAKLDAYKKKRADKYKILSQRNSKGQPLLKGRLQLLYEQIKQSTS